MKTSQTSFMPADAGEKSALMKAPTTSRK
jgi:hypothetical protein